MIKHYAYIGLGSNLEKPIEHIHNALSALAKLPETQLIKKSSLYISDSLLEGQPRYINAVACIETTLQPLILLDQLQAIENVHGRERKERWGARTLDLDIILYDDQVINCPRLTIPHSQIAVRSFVLMPLLEIAPNICLPDGQPVSAFLKHCPSLSLQKLSVDLGE